MRKINKNAHWVQSDANLPDPSTAQLDEIMRQEYSLVNTEDCKSDKPQDHYLHEYGDEDTSNPARLPIPASPSRIGTGNMHARPR